MKKTGLLFMIAILALTSCGSSPEEAAPVSYGLEIGVSMEKIDSAMIDSDNWVYIISGAVLSK